MQPLRIAVGEIVLVSIVERSGSVACESVDIVLRNHGLLGVVSEKAESFVARAIADCKPVVGTIVA